MTLEKKTIISVKKINKISTSRLIPFRESAPGEDERGRHESALVEQIAQLTDPFCQTSVVVEDYLEK